MTERGNKGGRVVRYYLRCFGDIGEETVVDTDTLHISPLINVCWLAPKDDNVVITLEVPFIVETRGDFSAWVLPAEIDGEELVLEPEEAQEEEEALQEVEPPLTAIKVVDIARLALGGKL